MQRVLSSGEYQGAIWTQGSPRIEEALYWFNLLLDTTVPLCGNSAQRPHGSISNDGPRNIVDAVDWIKSRTWADETGRNCAGVVLVSDQRVFAAREVAKVDARPGGYVAVGGHGGIVGSAGGEDAAILLHIPAMKHTYRSEVNVTRLPTEVTGVQASPRGLEPVKVTIKSAAGELLAGAIPRVAVIKDGSYIQEDWEPSESDEVDLLAMLQDRLARAPLAGFVNEGASPYRSHPGPCAQGDPYARGLQRHSGRVERARQHRRLFRQWGAVHRRLQSEFDQGAAVADGCFDEAGQFASGHGPRPSHRAGARGNGCEARRIPAHFPFPLMCV